MSFKKMQALYGLKWDPFRQDVPAEAILKTARFAQFCYRVETLTLDGGFALITGDPGLGKSASLRSLYDHLTKIPDITVGEITRPQSGIPDFYRELGSVFGVDLRASNKWGGYKSLREKWRHHTSSSLLRPVVMIDEAQEVPHAVLSELRLLSMEKFDSSCLLTVVLAGDMRLTQSFKEENLIPLGSRMKTRLVVEPWMKPQLMELLREGTKLAGNPNLLTPGLIETLAEHAAGSPRVLMNLASECLSIGMYKEATQLDEGLFFELFPPSAGGARRKAASVAAR
jgi:general secretion pathway protein A